MRRSLVRSLVYFAWLVLLTGSMGAVWGQSLSIVSESAVFDPHAQEVTFTLTFNRIPDFFTVDEFGRQADEFQYYVFDDNNPCQNELNSNVIIRGGEIYIAGDIRVRDTHPLGSGGPASGGWGPVRGSVPFELAGPVLTFTTPLPLIGDADGQLAYQLLIVEFGGSTDFTVGYTVPGTSAISVTIDTKPGSDANTINPKSNGVIPVAILSTETFDATAVDPLSVRFGPEGAQEAHGIGHIEDVNHDGEPDLVLHFKTQATGIQCGDTSASLTGETVDGEPIRGSDAIKTVGCKAIATASTGGSL